MELMRVQAQIRPWWKLGVGGRLLVPAIVVMLGVALVPPAAAAAGMIHTVQSGETLWQIAARYHLSVDILVGANRLSDPNRLARGQRLVIPPAKQRHPLAVDPVTAPPDPVTLTTTEWESMLITRVKQLLGIPYRWGGSTLRGFDCSGFVVHVLTEMGIRRVPRTTYAMYAQGVPVAHDDVRVGDLLFFETLSPGPSHTGIYVGNNTFVHASSAAGRVVITSLDDRYYHARFLGARRFSQAP